MPVLSNSRHERAIPLDEFERRLFYVPEGAPAWWYKGMIFVDMTNARNTAK